MLKFLILLSELVYIRIRAAEKLRHLIHRRLFTMAFLRFLLLATLASHASAFVNSPTTKSSLVKRQALWRHFVPEKETKAGVWDQSPPQDSPKDDNLNSIDFANLTKSGVLGIWLAIVLTIPSVSIAVSGGGLDYANLDITGQDFSSSSYKGKDFTQVLYARR